MFRNITIEEVKTVFKKQKAVVQIKITKKKKIYIEFVKLNLIELIYLKKIVI